MISLELTNEQKELQQKFHDISVSQLRPLGLDLDQAEPNPLDSRILNVIGREQLNNLVIPEAYGGKELDAVTMAIIIEELAWGCKDVASVYMATVHAIKTVLIGGSQEQKEKFLLPMLSVLGSVASFCATEEKGGSDSSFFLTTSRSRNNAYVINGVKNPVINAGSSSFYVVWANMNSSKCRAGIDAFVVPAASGGIVVGPYHSKLGERGAPTAQISFNDVMVSDKNLIGPPGSGYILLMQVVDFGRALVAAASVGLARAALEMAIEYAKERTIKNRSIISNQGISFTLAELATEIEAARLMVWKACRLIDLCQDYTTVAAMAKLFASEVAIKATSEGLLILGHKGIYNDSLMGKLERDAHVTRITEGTTQIQKAVIANQF